MVHLHLPENTHTTRDLIDFLRMTLPLLKGFDSLRWTSIQVNRNTVSEKHSDSNNLGPSGLLGVGEFGGGEFKYKDDKPIAIKGKAIRYDGTQPHSSLDFTGERWTVIPFSHSCWTKCTDKLRIQLKERTSHLFNLRSTNPRKPATRSQTDPDAPN